MITAIVFWTLVGAVVAGAHYVRGGGLERRAIRRQLLAAPALSSNTGDGSIARITGIVRSLKTVKAPLTHTPCVVARARLTPMRQGVAPGGLGVMPYETFVSVPFELETADGRRVTVASKYMRLDIVGTTVKRRAIGKERIDALLREFAIEDDWYRFDEVRVVDGDRVVIAGLVMHDVPDEPVSAERGFRDDQPPALRLTGNLDHPLAIGRASG